MSRLRFILLPVDKTIDYVSELQIPHKKYPEWLEPIDGDGAFTPGRITSFTFDTFPLEKWAGPWAGHRFMLSWYDRPAPTLDEIITFLKSIVDEFDEDEDLDNEDDDDDLFDGLEDDDLGDPDDEEIDEIGVEIDKIEAADRTNPIQNIVRSIIDTAIKEMATANNTGGDSNAIRS